MPTDADSRLLVWTGAIAGVSFKAPAWDRLMSTKLELPTEVTLVPEPDNKYDANAIKVTKAGLDLGYVPADQTKLIHQHLAAGIEVQAVLCQYFPENKPHQRAYIRVSVRKGDLR